MKRILSALTLFSVAAGCATANRLPSNVRPEFSQTCAPNAVFQLGITNFGGELVITRSMGGHAFEGRLTIANQTSTVQGLCNAPEYGTGDLTFYRKVGEGSQYFRASINAASLSGTVYGPGPQKLTMNGTSIPAAPIAPTSCAGNYSLDLFSGQLGGTMQLQAGARSNLVRGTAKSNLVFMPLLQDVEGSCNLDRSGSGGVSLRYSIAGQVLFVLDGIAQYNFSTREIVMTGVTHHNGYAYEWHTRGVPSQPGHSSQPAIKTGFKCQGAYSAKSGNTSGTILINRVAVDRPEFEGEYTQDGQRMAITDGLCEEVSNGVGRISFNRNAGQWGNQRFEGLFIYDAQAKRANFYGIGITRDGVPHAFEAQSSGSPNLPIPVPASAGLCEGTYRLSTLNFPATLKIQRPAADGEFSGTIRFDSVGHDEVISGQCLKSSPTTGDVQFTRAVQGDVQKFIGTYSMDRNRVKMSGRWWDRSHGNGPAWTAE